jgi:hypothetical protein
MNTTKNSSKPKSKNSSKSESNTRSNSEEETGYLGCLVVVTIVLVLFVFAVILYGG